MEKCVAPKSLFDEMKQTLKFFDSSVVDIAQFLELPKELSHCLTVDEAELYFLSGLYVSKGGGLVMDDKRLQL